MLPRIFLLLGILPFVFGCRRTAPLEGLELQPTPVLQVQNLYGVVVLPTLRLRKEPSEESGIVTVLVRGTIVVVESIDQREVILEGTEGRWMKVRYEGRRGWGFGGYIHVYESLEEARRGVESLRR